MIFTWNSKTFKSRKLNNGESGYTFVESIAALTVLIVFTIIFAAILLKSRGRESHKTAEDISVVAPVLSVPPKIDTSASSK
jgi:hypothetical protein